MSRRSSARRSSGIPFVLWFATVLTSAPVEAKPRYSIQALTEPAPKEHVSAELLAVLEPVGLRILDRKKKPFADVWLRRQLKPQKPRKETGLVYGHLPEGSLLGVIRLHERSSDFRGTRVLAGVFTMRNAIQPQDGEHLGVSETRDFTLLAPAKLDVKTAAMPTKELVKLSTKVSGAKHPATLYLIKLYDKAKKLPRIVEEEDLEYWILDCEIRNAPSKQQKEAGGAKPSAAPGSIRLSIVIEGEAEEV